MSSSTPARLTRIDPVPLDVGAHLDAVRSTAAGAGATFVGQGRDHDPGVAGEVTALEYSAHPDAQEILRRIADSCASRPGVLGVAVSHRIGLLAVGDLAIVAAVATAHRSLAFEVCSALVEQVKAELPIWKREVLADCSHVWVGSQ